MENERHFYHLSSDGMSSEILFKTPEEFIAGMNRIALCLLGTAIVLFAFCLMDNHFHLVVYGTYEECKDFVKRYRRRTGQWLVYHGRDGRLLEYPEVDIKCIPDEEYLKNAIVYDIMNPPKAFMPYLPQGYRWSSASLYFNDLSSVMNQYKRVDSLKQAEIHRLLDTKASVPPHWLVSSDGLIWPGCYTDYKYVEKLFRTPLVMIERMNRPVENQINKDMCFDRLSIPDMELLEKTKAIARSMFGTGSISDLDARQRVELAKRVHSLTKVSFKQIAKAVHLKYESLGILTKG